MVGKFNYLIKISKGDKRHINFENIPEKLQRNIT